MNRTLAALVVVASLCLAAASTAGAGRAAAVCPSFKQGGPRGYHCFAEPDSRRGRATSGTCFKGTLAFPGTGFAWFEA
jgi:hypothetical protein